MRIATGVLAAVLLGGVSWGAAAQTQGTPQGTYLRSCTNASVQGDSLTALCRRSDGREDRTTLSGYRRCVGDIGNINGALQCNGSGGEQLRGQVMDVPRGGPGYGEQRGGYGERGGPGYGEQRGGPGYGEQRA